MLPDIIDVIFITSYIIVTIGLISDIKNTLIIDINASQTNPIQKLGLQPLKPKRPKIRKSLPPPPHHLQKHPNLHLHIPHNPIHILPNSTP